MNHPISPRCCRLGAAVCLLLFLATVSAPVWPQRTGTRAPGTTSSDPYGQGIDYPALSLPAQGVVERIAFSADGSLMRVFTETVVHTWETAHWRELDKIEAWRLMEPTGTNVLMDVSEDGRWLAIGDSNRSNERGGRRAGLPRLVKLVDMRSKTVAQTLTGHTDGISGLQFSPDGSRLLSIGRDSQVRVWEVPSGRELAMVRDASLATMLRRSADRSRVYFVTDGLREGRTALQVYDLASAKRLQTVPIPSRLPTGLFTFAVSADGKLAAVSLANDRRTGGGVHFWDLAAGRETGFGCTTPSTVIADGLAFSFDGRRLVVAGRRGLPSEDRQFDGFEVWEGLCNTLLRSFRRNLRYEGGFDFMSALAISPDGRRLAHGGSGGVQIWNLEPGAQAATQDPADALEADLLARNAYSMARSGAAPEQAAQTYLRAAEKGDATAAAALSQHYSEGKGLAKDPQAAVRWAAVAIERGNAFGRSAMVQALLAAGDRERALMWAYVIARNAPEDRYAVAIIPFIEKGLPAERAEEARRAAEACWARLLRGC